MTAIARGSAKLSGSETRRRIFKVDTRWEAIEHVSLIAAAQAAGLSKGGYIRALVLGCPGPRAQRVPPVNAQALAKATAALNKAGTNINAIARILHSGGSEITARQYDETLGDIRLAVGSILEIVASARRS